MLVVLSFRTIWKCSSERWPWWFLTLGSLEKSRCTPWDSWMLASKSQSVKTKHTSPSKGMGLYAYMFPSCSADTPHILNRDKSHPQFVYLNSPWPEPDEPRFSMSNCLRRTTMEWWMVITCGITRLTFLTPMTIKALFNTSLLERFSKSARTDCVKFYN